MSKSSHIIPDRYPPTLPRLPRPVYAQVESFSPGTRIKDHHHDFEQLTYAINGVVGIQTATGSFLAVPQRAIWIPAGLEHSFISMGGAEMRSLNISSTALAAPPRHCTVYQITPLVRELICAVADFPHEYDEAGPQGRLVHVLLDQLADLTEVPFSMPLPGDPRLVAICERIQRSPRCAWTMKEWAPEAGMSERTMIRWFQRETGLSFRAWHQRLRLLLGVTALESGQSVTSVAMDSGYDSVSAYIAAFRRQFGRTPGRWVKDFAAPQAD
ncbi:MAG: helix-turn-helix transcriptional regulator [Holophaga sp.]|jgi:AraC-like DNA-binding protein/quercetin dioxygenase-like cupin family protein